jgi:hypothetical protein
MSTPVPLGTIDGASSQDTQSVGLKTVDKEKKERDPILDDLGGDDDESLHDQGKPAGSLYVAPIERYVDDGELYQQKYNDYSRVKYWEFLLDRPRQPKLPHGHQSWTTQGGNANFAEEILHYPTFEKRLLALTVHHYWDYAYLYLFGLWIILMTAYFDSLVRLYILIPTYLLYFPLLLMVFTQIIPMLSIIYLVSKCNDLVKLVASRTFGSWVSPSLPPFPSSSLLIPSPPPSSPSDCVCRHSLQCWLVNTLSIHIILVIVVKIWLESVGWNGLKIGMILIWMATQR